MGIIFISLNLLLIANFGILSVASRVFIEEMCEVVLAPTIIMISGSTFQSLFAMFSISD